MGEVFSAVEKYTGVYAEKWEQAAFYDGMLPEYARQHKKKKQKSIDDGINGLFGMLKNLPEDGPERERCLEKLKGGLDSLARTQLDIQNPEFEKKMLDGIMEVTERFISQAREFDPSVKMIDIMQAMRNVWIMNLIQLIAGRDVEYTPSVFAYSMLYPYTDNFLDDPEVSIEKKEEFNRRLSLRLKGHALDAEGPQEEKVFSLIGMIEGQYPRERYHGVYDSILSIQHGQIKSLRQQKSEKEPGKKEVLRISAEKGGTSVLADAYLVCGDLDCNLFEFAFGFGFVLQLIDDLQDVETDMQNGHMTMFSRIAGKEKLDDAAFRLKAFVAGAIDYEKTGSTPYIRDIEKLITDNCILMIFEAVSKNRRYFTREYLKFAGAHSALGLNYFVKANKNIRKKMRALEGKGIL